MVINKKVSKIKKILELLIVEIVFVGTVFVVIL